MEGFLQHMAPGFLHPALQSFGCGAFRPIPGAFHPLYPPKAFSRHFQDQYTLAQQARQPFFGELRDEARSPPLYRPGPFSSGVVTVREGSSSPGSVASASPDPRPKEEDTASTCASEDHDYMNNGQKLRCGVCGARLGPGVAQAHFMQELQHLYSLSAPPREPLPPHHDEDARWETYQRIKANRQRRLRMKSRKRHSVESLLYDDDVLEDRERDRARKAETIRCDEDETVDVEGDSIGWPEGALVTPTPDVGEKEPCSEAENPMRTTVRYSEDLEISSTNDGVQSPEHSIRSETPKVVRENCGTPASVGIAGTSSPPMAGPSSGPGRVPEVTTSRVDRRTPEQWPPASAQPLGGEAYLHVQQQMQQQHQHREVENQPSSTDPHN